MLSDRIAALSAPDRAIDAEIAKALGEVPTGAFQPCESPDLGTFATGAYSLWTAPDYTSSLDNAMTTASPALQAHVTCNALDLFGTMGYSGGKFTEALAIAICVVALREKGL